MGNSDENPAQDHHYYYTADGTRKYRPRPRYTSHNEREPPIEDPENKTPRTSATRDETSKKAQEQGHQRHTMTDNTIGGNNRNTRKDTPVRNRRTILRNNPDRRRKTRSRPRRGQLRKLPAAGEMQSRQIPHRVTSATHAQFTEILHREETAFQTSTQV